MNFLDEIARFLAEVGLIAEGLSVESIFERHEVSMWHFRLLVLVFLCLGTDKPPLLGHSFQIVLRINCPIEYSEFPILAVFWLAEYLHIEFLVYLLQFLRHGLVYGIALLLLDQLLSLFFLLLLFLRLLFEAGFGANLAGEEPFTDDSDLLASFFFVVLQKLAMLLESISSHKLLFLLVGLMMAILQ